jgi:hypothetical protein
LLRQLSCQVTNSSGTLTGSYTAQVKIDEKLNVLIIFQGSEMNNARIGSINNVTNNANLLKVVRNGPDEEERSFELNKLTGSAAVILKDEGEVYASASLQCK